MVRGSGYGRGGAKWGEAEADEDEGGTGMFGDLEPFAMVWDGSLGWVGKGWDGLGWGGVGWDRLRSAGSNTMGSYGMGCESSTNVGPC